MKSRIPPTALLVVAFSVVSACYTDAGLESPDASGRVRVMLTDAPAPSDMLESVEVYVVEVSASTDAESAPAQRWQTLSSPGRWFDLLTLQQGRTVLVGEGEIGVGDYSAIRLTIDVDSTAVTLANGRVASVFWPAPGRIALPVIVAEPVAVQGSGSEFVIDFDAGRSFVRFPDDPSYDLLFTPFLRAVDGYSTGTMSGRVFGDADTDGVPEPLENAGVTVLRGDPAEPAYAWELTATGRTAQGGEYTLGFLNEGNYIVLVDAPFQTTLASAFETRVTIVAGEETRHSVTLPPFDGTALTIEGHNLASLGNSVTLRAELRNGRGDLVSHPAVRWLSTNPAVARVRDIGEYTTVDAVSLGSATVFAMAGGLTDSLAIEVVNGSE